VRRGDEAQQNTARSAEKAALFWGSDEVAPCFANFNEIGGHFSERQGRCFACQRLAKPDCGKYDLRNKQDDSEKINDDSHGARLA
jgi:hypothetical protein